MAKWVEFEKMDNDLITINVDHVVHIIGEPKTPDHSRLCFDSSLESLKFITVKGNYATTREKLRS